MSAGAFSLTVNLHHANHYQFITERHVQAPQTEVQAETLGAAGNQAAELIDVAPVRMREYHPQAVVDLNPKELRDFHVPDTPRLKPKELTDITVRPIQPLENLARPADLKLPEAIQISDISMEGLKLKGEIKPPDSERLAKEIQTLPINPHLTEPLAQAPKEVYVHKREPMGHYHYHYRAVPVQNVPPPRNRNVWFRPLNSTGGIISSQA